ncbi:LysR family transcriptional regulator [Stenotrophomonas terrae]|uniref:LysR family transcriptional regulator n=2 Tax=Stenotrophomonas terrae TaxID=405446 RepID=A0A0R0CHD4_9GAMM|nr:LysR family transcriptional regulator [Stenotrophomonas terrae]
MSGMFSFESLSGLVAFSVTVNSGSFAAAGRKLGLSASAVGKAVDRLELKLGARLFNRSTRALALTNEGEVVFRYAAKILNDLQDAQNELAQIQASPRGRLKISVPSIIGRRIVLPALPEFHAQFPDVVIDLSLNDLKVDVIEERYDLVLRLGELEDSSLQARRIGAHSFTTCASPDYLARHGTPQTVLELQQHHCIHYRFPTTGRQETWAFLGAASTPPIKPSIVLDDGEALASAALAGLGIIQAPAYLVKDDIANGRLQALLGGHPQQRGSIWLLWPARNAQAPRLRAFIEFIAERVAAQLA